MVDTGTNTALVLDDWAATTLKLPFAPMPGYVNGQASRLAYVDKISLSGIGQDGARHKLNFSLMPNIVHVLPLRYMDTGYALSGYGGSRLAGIMGLPLLEFFIARFDFAAKTLTLFDSHRYLLPPARAVTLALERRNALYYVPLRLPGQDASALLFDTGSVFTSLPEAALTGLRPLAATKKSYRGVDNVVHITDKLRLPNLQFDNYTMPQAVVVMEPKRRSTSLGLDMLARFRVTLDTAHRLLFLEPLPSGGTWLPGRAGLSLRRDNGHYYVAAVEARPALRAGVRVGDRILNVDGMALTMRRALWRNWRWMARRARWSRCWFNIEMDGKPQPCSSAAASFRQTSMPASAWVCKPPMAGLSWCGAWHPVPSPTKPGCCPMMKSCRSTIC